jgi:chromatin remodeling complex protein RSC6
MPKVKSKKSIDDDDNSSEEEMGFTEKLAEIREALHRNYQEQRQLDKKLKELLTIHKKDIRHLKGSSNSGKHSGFNKPEMVPEALADLLEIEEEFLPRSQVTKLLYQYFKENDMYNKDNKRIIIPNRTIRKIFGMTRDDELNFYNLQTWLKKLYVDE